MTPPDAAHDPIVARTALAHGTIIPVLGIPVSFETSDPQVLGIIEEAFGAWRILDQVPALVADAHVTFRIWIEEGDEAGPRSAEIVRYQPDPDRVVLRTRASVVIADAGRGDAAAWLTSALLADRPRVRHHVLEAATLALLDGFDRQRIPAAAIARDRTALLLAGPAGSGKSTLAYLAGTHGYRVLADDAVYIQLRPQLRVWGMPGHIHLSPGARRHFPELDDDTAEVLSGGVQRLVVSAKALRALPELPLAPSAGVCVLAPGGAGPTLEVVPGEAMEAELSRAVADGANTLGAAASEAVRALSRYGGWRLDPGADPHAVLPLIAGMFEAMDAD